ncbi:MAG TPA: LysR family transcriptional regulator [Chloroflexota bacterium]|jgi:DNA-binding transcriptional LysR family regulator|nr:LysR family transcriptional regulator [Chloroflexota bacterium]
MTADRRATGSTFTTQQLHVFHTVAQTGNFTRAAELLHLAQPAVSAHIAALQAHLGVRLFAREGRGARLTEAGAEFAAYAEQLLAAQARVRQAAEDMRALRRGSVHVAASTTAGIYVVPPLLGAFHRRYPGLRISLAVANRGTVLQRVQAGDSDLGILGMLEPSEKVVAEPFLPNELVVIAPPWHQLAQRAARAGPIALAALAAEPLLTREPGSGTRTDMEQIFARAGLTMHIGQELGSTGAIKEGVLAGLGLAVVPRTAIALHLETAELVILPVAGFPVRRDWHVARLTARTLSPAAAALRAQLLQTPADAAAHLVTFTAT